MGTFVTILIQIICFPYKIYEWIYKKCFTLDITQKGPIFITGCDTGFGHYLALRLVRNGIHTFASCLTETGETELKKASAQAPGKLWTLHLDVTDQASINKALESVKHTLGHGKGLWGLVNNAGILGLAGPDDWLTVDDYKKALDVNFFGVIRVTQAFKPLIKLQKGRIIVTSSVFGRVAPAGCGPYITSKFASESYCDVIRRELRKFGVSVHVLEPGFFATNIIDPDCVAKGLQALWQRLPSDTKEEYGDEFYEKSLSAIHTNLPPMCSSNVDLVVDAYYDALTSWWPQTRYHVGLDAKLFFIPLSNCPTFVQDVILETMQKMKGLPKPKRTLNEHL